MPRERGKETDYYGRICQKIELHLSTAIGPDFRVAAADNTTFPTLKDQVASICRRLGVKSLSDQFPQIRTDICFGVLDRSNNVKFGIIEVKGPAKTVGLAEFSQLIGYLQVAQTIEIGLLLLIVNQLPPSILTADLSDVINTGRLAAKWTVLLGSDENRRLNYETGICSYEIDGSIDFVNTSGIDGFSSWIGLAKFFRE